MKSAGTFCAALLLALVCFIDSPLGAIPEKCRVDALAPSAHPLDDKIQKLQLELAWLRNDRERALKYFQEGKLFGFPDALLIFAAMREATQRSVGSMNWMAAYQEIKASPGKHFEAGLEILASILKEDLLERPGRANQADAQAEAISQARGELKKLLESSYGSGGWEDWITPAKVLELARSLKEYRADPKASPAEVWRQLAEAYQPDFGTGESPDKSMTATYLHFGNYNVGYYYSVDQKRYSRGSTGDWYTFTPPDPVALLKKREAHGFFSGARHARRTIEAFQNGARKQLEKLNQEIAAHERELSALLGKDMAPPPTAPYSVPDKLAQVLDQKPKDTPTTDAWEELKYQEELLKKYFTEDSFFNSETARRLLRGDEPQWAERYRSLFVQFDPSRIPRPEASGEFAPAALSAFREHLTALGVDAEQFAKYSRELTEIKKDPKVYSHLETLSRDQRAGLPHLQTLRLVVGTAPSGINSQAVAKNPGAASTQSYVQPPGFTHGLHEALTALSIETARRGEGALPQHLLKVAALAGEGLRRELRKGSLTRDKALEKLAPPLQAAASRAAGYARDFAVMENDLQQLRQRVEEAVKQATDRGRNLAEQAKTVKSGTPAAREFVSNMEEVSLGLDELKAQLRGVDQLEKTLAALRHGLTQTQEFISAFQDKIQYVDPLAPNSIDNGELTETLKNLEAMTKPR